MRKETITCDCCPRNIEPTSPGWTTVELVLFPEKTIRKYDVCSTCSGQLLTLLHRRKRQYTPPEIQGPFTENPRT